MFSRLRMANMRGKISLIKILRLIQDKTHTEITKVL